MATANNDSIRTRIRTTIYLIICGFVCPTKFTYTRYCGQFWFFRANKIGILWDDMALAINVLL